jgi:mannitol/fructose-specific phosphotransferase system IIA component (Ntr-type)
MHESTISRVTSNKYVHTPQGTFELKYFFTSSIARKGGGDALSSESIRQRIRQIVQAENPDKPLSDKALAEIFAQDNIKLARRTVAKYREQLGILSTTIDAGIAVPHAKIAAATEIQVCFGRSQAGIQWGAPDRQLVHLILLMVAPQSASERYLQTLATLCRFLRDSNNRRRLLSSTDGDLVPFFASAKELQ